MRSISTFSTQAIEIIAEYGQQEIWKFYYLYIFIPQMWLYGAGLRQSLALVRTF